jgi:hypothetical protein
MIALSVICQFETARRQARIHQDVGDRLDQIGLLQLYRGQVDRDLEAGIPLCGFTRGFAQNPFADRVNRPGFLRDRNELVRAYQAPLGVDPAQQRLVPDHRPGLHGVLGLIDEMEFVAFDRMAQFGRKLPPRPGILIHARLIIADMLAPPVLGPVHGKVGIVHQGFEIRAIAWEHRDPKAGPGSGSGGLRLPDHRRNRPAGDRRNPTDPPGSQNIFRRQFVAAQPGDRFAFDAAGLQPMTDLDNRTIALGMAPSGR